MKVLLSHTCTVFTGLCIAAGQFSLSMLLFGQKFAIVYTALQVVAAIWIVYEILRAPLMDD